MPSPAADFYSWHADNGHVPEWDGADGVDCGESFAAPQMEAEPG